MNSNLLLLQNPWWQSPVAIADDEHLKAIRNKAYYFSHPQLETIQFNAGDFHILRGARQVGKTTFVKECIARLIKDHVEPRDIFFMSCEGMEGFKELQQILVEWRASRGKSRAFIFLDEISFVPDWQRAILTLSNLGFLANTCLFVTGSNARDLKESSERFPGRRGKGEDLSLYPLAPWEYRRLKYFINFDDKKIIDTYLRVGGFPHAIRDYVDGGTITDTTFLTYRNWVIGDASRYGLAEESLRHLMYRVAETQTTRITWPTLIENTLIKSHETGLRYLEHLQDAFLCEIVYSYDPGKKGPAVQKARKAYFIDPLLRYLGFAWKRNITNIWGWINEELKRPQMRAEMLESAFVVGARRKNQNVYFWYSTKEKKEVDLVLETDGKLKLFDVKLGSGKPYRALNTNVDICSEEDLLSFFVKTF